MRNIKLNMSNSSKQTPTPSNTAEIVENKRQIKLRPLQWNKYKPNGVVLCFQ